MWDAVGRANSEARKTQQEVIAMVRRRRVRRCAYSLRSSRLLKSTWRHQHGCLIGPRFNCLRP